MGLEQAVKLITTKDAYVVKGPGIQFTFDKDLHGPNAALSLKKQEEELVRIPTVQEYALLMKAALTSGSRARDLIESFYDVELLTNTVLFKSAYQGKELIVALDNPALKEEKLVLPDGLKLRDILAAEAAETWMTPKRNGVRQTEVTSQSGVPARIIWDLVIGRGAVNAGGHQSMGATREALLHALFNGPEAAHVYYDLGRKREKMGKGFYEASVSDYPRFMTDQEIRERGLSYLALGSKSRRCHVYANYEPTSMVSARMLKR